MRTADGVLELLVWRGVRAHAPLLFRAFWRSCCAVLLYYSLMTTQRERPAPSATSIQIQRVRARRTAPHTGSNKRFSSYRHSKYTSRRRISEMEETAGRRFHDQPKFQKYSKYSKSSLLRNNRSGLLVTATCGGGTATEVGGQGTPAGVSK